MQGMAIEAIPYLLPDFGFPLEALRAALQGCPRILLICNPNNPTGTRLDEVLYRIETSQSNNVYDITGPSVFQDVLAQRSHTWRLAQHTCLQGNFSNKFFQYLDKPQGCWTQEQKLRRVVHH